MPPRINDIENSGLWRHIDDSQHFHCIIKEDLIYIHWMLGALLFFILFISVCVGACAYLLLFNF